MQFQCVYATFKRRGGRRIPSSGNRGIGGRIAISGTSAQGLLKGLKPVLAECQCPDFGRGSLVRGRQVGNDGVNVTGESRRGVRAVSEEMEL